MPFALTMPKLSPTMTEGTIVKWHHKENDLVKEGTLIIEVATDKATVEYNILDGGYLRKILINEGETASVNQPIALLSDTLDEDISAKLNELQTKKAATVATPKETSSAETPTSKQPQIAVSGINLSHFKVEPPLEEKIKSPLTSSGYVKASPLAKKLAKEQNKDLSTTRGSGPRGEIKSHDVEKAQVDSGLQFGSKKEPVHPAGSFERIPLTPMRKIIGERLQQSKSFIPHFYLTQTIDADPLMNLREELKATNVLLTVNDFIIKAVAIALKEHPVVNSGFDPASETIVSFKTIDISVAVSIDQGLITPILRHADFKNLGEISAEVKVLAKKAKEGTLQPHEYKGGSFTISNLGRYGIDSFYAIINPPQAAILAVGAILEVPVVEKGTIVIGKQMTLNLSLDHRVIDGAVAAEFAATLKNLLEHPAALLIH